MKITKKIIRQTLEQLEGEDVMPVVEYLIDKKDISEFKISADLDIEIHAVRNILYRLNSHNLATYIRKKDRQKGWYISYWTLNKSQVKYAYKKLQEQKISRLKIKLKREQESREGLYICPNLCTRMNFEHAMEFNFKCHECGRLLNQQDNTRTIEHLKTMIEELEAVA